MIMRENDLIKCAIYARYSSNNQREASIEDQIRKCREAAKSKGWIILEDHIYYDKAQSGTQIDSRKDFKKMLSIAISENCPFQKIIVDDTSRIARNTKEALNIFSLLNFYGIHIYYVAQGIDTTEETAEEMITINSLIDSIYIRNLSKETHRGIEGQVLKGFSSGGKRYGYYSSPVYTGMVDIYGNPIVEGYILKINPEEAEVVKKIFHLFGEKGYSARRIVNLLNKEVRETGKPKPPRGDYWRVSTIIGSKKDFRGILNNEIYIGKYTWNRTSSIRNPENGRKKRKLKDPIKWITIPKPELKIISDELWLKVKKRQKYLKEIANGRYTRAKKIYSKNLFTGLMTCGLCKGNIVIVSGGKYAKYGCSNNWNKGASVCCNTSKIDKTKIESAIFHSLNLDFKNEKFANYLLSKINTIIRLRYKENRNISMYNALMDELKKINKEIDNFIKAIKFGIITETVKNQLTLAEKRKEEIDLKLQSINQKKFKAPRVKTEMVENYLKNIFETLSIHPVLGRDFLHKIVNNIVLTPVQDKIKVTIFPNASYLLQRQPICLYLEKSTIIVSRRHKRKKVA